MKAPLREIENNPAITNPVAPVRGALESFQSGGRVRLFTLFALVPGGCS
jgi:hypothetical protein